MASGGTPSPKERNPFWKPAISITVLALALWGADRSQGFPAFSVLGFLGLVCAILAAAVSVLREDDLKAMRTSMGKAGTRMRDRAREAGGWARRHRTPIIAVVGVLAVSGTVLVTMLKWPAAADDGCPHPGELRLLTTPENLAAYKELASSYELHTANQNTADQHCPTEHLHVYAASPESVHDALIAGWASDGKLFPDLMLGPRPDAWLPGSTADVREVQFDAHQSAKPDPVRGAQSIGSSALALASSAQIAGKPVTWSAGVLAAMRPGAALFAPDPRSSMAAAFAAAVYLRAPSGLVDLSEAHRRERLISGSGAVVHDDYPDAVCHFALATEQESRAVITTRQMWLDYAVHKGLNGSCVADAGASQGGPVIVPTDSPILDFPLVEFTWTGESRRAALKSFTDWLAVGSGRAARELIGLDGPRNDCVVLYQRDEHDQRPKASRLTIPDDKCMPQDLYAALNLYDKAQVPGAVLLAVDASGSMNAPVGRDGATRIALAREAVGEALNQIGEKDSVGLWTFAGQDYAKPVPLGRGDLTQLARVREKLQDVQPGGKTPLYDTILAGLAEVGGYDAGSDTPPSRALFVLTDGQDSGERSLDEVAGLVRSLTQAKPGQRPDQAAAAPQLFIVATGSASCTGAKGLEVLTVAGRGICRETELSDVGRTMADLFERLWKGE